VTHKGPVFYLGIKMEMQIVKKRLVGVQDVSSSDVAVQNFFWKAKKGMMVFAHVDSDGRDQRKKNDGQRVFRCSASS